MQHIYRTKSKTDNRVSSEFWETGKVENTGFSDKSQISIPGRNVGLFLFCPV